MRLLKFFQLRLDFETFVITGPSTGESTEAANAGKGLFGKPNEYGCIYLQFPLIIPTLIPT